jgi:hypothetical protein
VGDDSAARKWPGVSRDGEPLLTHGPSIDAVTQQNEYKIRTTPLPGGPYGDDWRGLFNSRFTGHTPIPGWHDGNKITAYCWPDDELNLIEKVDSAIEYANQELAALRR